MRGKGCPQPPQKGEFGITPAYAGKSSGSKIFRVLPWDHPRICGEKPSGQHGADFAAGITPAYAGKRTTLDCLEVLRRDHPRICGEKFIVHPRRILQAGSPPHMRGKETKFLSGGMAERITPAYAGKVANSGGGRVLCGITPAYAGKSKLSPNCIVVKRDHPRICGEKSQHIGARYIPKGSPPHMRGKASCLYFRVPLTGITPAYAGKSYRERYGHHQGRDHPRICGEKSTRKRRTDSTLGSPPHMRGKVLSFVFRLNRDGITPAYAGKRPLSLVL